MSEKNKEFNNQVRNILANELGLNRPEIEALIQQTVNERIDKMIKDGKLKGWIEDQVHRTLDHMVKGDRRDHTSIRSIVAEVSEKIVREKLTLSLK